MKEFSVNTINETIDIAFKLAELMKNGGIILLDGDLGAGKTVFTTGIAKAININEYIKSPTFTIVNEYYGDKKLNHFDVYRLENEDDLDDIGFWEYIVEDAFVVIEWSKKIASVLPKDTVEVTITKDLTKGLDYRVISVKFNGKYKELEEKLK